MMQRELKLGDLILFGAAQVYRNDDKLKNAYVNCDPKLSNEGPVPAIYLGCAEESIEIPIGWNASGQQVRIEHRKMIHVFAEGAFLWIWLNPARMPGIVRLS